MSNEVYVLDQSVTQVKTVLWIMESGTDMFFSIDEDSN